MKCPYCNKQLQKITNINEHELYWCGCNKTHYMIGTLTMWIQLTNNITKENCLEKLCKKYEKEYKK